MTFCTFHMKSSKICLLSAHVSLPWAWVWIYSKVLNYSEMLHLSFLLLDHTLTLGCCGAHFSLSLLFPRSFAPTQPFCLDSWWHWIQPLITTILQWQIGPGPGTRGALGVSTLFVTPSTVGCENSHTFGILKLGQLCEFSHLPHHVQTREKIGHVVLLQKVHT